MATGVICPAPILTFFNNAGQFNAGGSVLTQVGGVNAATYQDVGLTTPLPNPIPLNSRGEVSNAAGISCQLFLTPNTVYVFTLYDANGNQIDQASYVNGIQLNASTIGQYVYPQSAAEASALVTPTNYQYQWGDLRRYGATGGPYGAIPTVDDSVAFATAVSTGYVVIPEGMAFQVVSQTTAYSGEITILGYGPTSQLYCDGPLVTVTNGNSSLISNVYLDSITTPLVFMRNVVSTTSTTCSTIGPQTFTTDLSTVGGGATSGTLTAAVTNGTYTCRFQDGEIRVVTVASGTAMSWSTALSTTKGPITKVGFLTIVCANGSNIAAGMTVTGNGLWNGTTVAGIVGSTVTLTDPCSYTHASTPVQFFSITFNTGTTAYATLTSTKADGYRPPQSEDDIYSMMSPAQIAATLIGPTLVITGNHVIVEKIYGRFITLNMLNCNYSQVRDCDFKGGLNATGQCYAGIQFLNTTAGRTYGNSAIRNRVREHGNEGIFMQGCTQWVITNNFIYGCGDSGIEMYGDYGPNTPLDTYFNASNAGTSANNVCIGNSQGGINYTANAATISGFNTAMCSSTGEYCAWQQFGGFGYTGDGWAISNLNAEYNGGAALAFTGNRSTLSNITARENQYNNYGSFPILGFEGQGNMISNVRAWQETNRSTNYTVLVSATGGLQSGNMLGLSTTLHNMDLRDAVTSAGQCLQLSGNVERFNVRTNGSPYDQSIEAKSYVMPTYTPAGTIIDLSLGTFFSVSATNNTNMSFIAPVQATAGQIFRIQIQNNSGGAMGTITFPAAYHLAGGGTTVTAPASDTNVTLEFIATQGGNVFWELSRTSGNVVN